MRDAWSLDILPAAADREAALAVRARDAVRRWIDTPTDDIGDAIDRVGREALRDAAEVSVRLLRDDAAGHGAEALLGDVAAFAASLDAPLPPLPARRWPWSKPAPAPAPSGDFASLVDRLLRARDAATRSLIRLKADRVRFAGVDAALEEVVHFIRALDRTVDAATRELRADDPERTRLWHEAVAPRVAQRARDLLTQLAVTRQGLLALDLLIENQARLEAALEAARTTTLAALQTAVAARRAVATGEALSAQASALARTAEAAADPASGDRAARALGDAVAQARAALDAIAATPNRSPLP